MTDAISRERLYHAFLSFGSDAFVKVAFIPKALPATTGQRGRKQLKACHLPKQGLKGQITEQFRDL